MWLKAEGGGPGTLHLGNRLDCGGDAACLGFGAEVVAPPAGDGGPSTPPLPPPAPSSEPSAPDQFASPAALLRRLQAEASMRAELRSRVRDSFQVLQECPWVSPRPAWVVVQLQTTSPGASGGEGAAAGGGEGEQVVELYTMRTRQDREEEGAELASLLGWGSGDSRLGLSKMHDGALAFADESAALDFCDSLEAEAAHRPGSLAFEVVELSSHELFRLTAGSDALVVHFEEREDGWVPAPEDVRAELRRSTAADDM